MTFANPFLPQPTDEERRQFQILELSREMDGALKTIAHFARTIREVEGEMLEQERIFRETVEMLELERELYARKFNELQCLVKRLLEDR